MTRTLDETTKVTVNGTGHLPIAHLATDVPHVGLCGATIRNWLPLGPFLRCAKCKELAGDGQL
jgi:hypothetical protein